jgi:hypothetical protein
VAFLANPESAQPDAARALFLGDSSGTYKVSDSILQAAMSPDGYAVVFTASGAKAPCLSFTERTGLSPILKCADDMVPAANEPSYLYPGSLSLGARYTVFTSEATNLNAQLVPEMGFHTYIMDMYTSKLQLIDVRLDGKPGQCEWPSLCLANPTPVVISEDGGVIAFESGETNLVSGDSNHAFDVFVWRRSDSSITRVSVGPNGQAMLDSWLESMSSDGRFVAFSTASPDLVPGDSNGDTDIFVRDTMLGTTQLVSSGLDGRTANGSSGHASISGDGRYVAFISDGSDFVANDTTHSCGLYVRDLVTSTTTCLSAPTGYVVANDQMSADGHTIVYVVDKPADSDGADTRVMVARAG